MNEYPQINNGKKPNEILNAKLIFWLPPDSPYGNLQLKYMDIIQRIDIINHKIIDTFNIWNRIHSTQGFTSFLLMQHRSLNEEIVFHIRRITDELIGLVYLLKFYDNNNCYPNIIKINDIGTLKKNFDQLPLFNKYSDFLDTMNNISNAFKHSFINSDVSLIIGQLEPCITALHLPSNNLSKDLKFYNISLKNQLVAPFNELYSDITKWLNTFSKKHRN